MKQVAAVITLFVCSLAAYGQSASSVLKQAEKAMGGKAFRSVASFTKTGAVTRINDGARGRYLLETVKPNLFFERLNFGDVETEVAFNRKSGWSWYKNGIEDYPPETAAGKSNNDFKAATSYRNNLWFNAKSDKAGLSAGAQSSIEGRAVNLVLMTFPKGSIIRMYFDVVSGQLVRDVVPDGDNEIVTDYADFRRVAGISVPFFERRKDEGVIYEIRLEEVKVNQATPTSVFDFPKVTGQPLPDVQALLSDVQANEDRLDLILDNYSYIQDSVSREIDKNGHLQDKESETVQMSFYKGYRIHRTIAKNDKPLSTDDQAKEDKDVQKQVDEIEKRIAKNESKNLNGPPAEDNNRRVSVAELLRASLLVNPRRERFGGRDCLVFDFEPNPAFDMKNAKTALKFFGKTAGVMWIDEKDKQVARVEAVLYDSYSIGGGVLAKINKGAAFTLEKQRFNDEIWLPSYSEINLSVRVLMLKGLSVNQVIRAHDYRRFETEVKGAKVGDDKKP